MQTLHKALQNLVNKFIERSWSLCLLVGAYTGKGGGTNASLKVFGNTAVEE